MKKEVFLRVEDLCLYFRTVKGPIQAVDRVSFQMERSRTLVVVGESGCGKSSLARALLRLLPRNVHTYTGRVFLTGTDVMQLKEEKFRREVRWVRTALVPQGVMNSLNPVVRVEEQVAEPLLVHNLVKREEALERVRGVFNLVGVSTDFLNRYPFELSGGMRQRVAIAMTLATNPELVILDEPTSALDLLTQANIMNILKEIKWKFKTTFLLISHDIAISSELADKVAVMYAGQLVELAEATSFYHQPLHPYSQKLMASVPTLREKKVLESIAGQPPSLLHPPVGCRFAERCSHKSGQCKEEPLLREVGKRRWVKCWLWQRDYV